MQPPEHTELNLRYRILTMDVLLNGLGHGRIIKWTQQIGFLTLAGMARVVKGNHGNDSKREIARILRLSQFGEI